MARRGRGVDFKQKFNTSRWAEDGALTAFLKVGIPCVRLGLSGVSPDNLIASKVGEPKVPDLLVFDPARINEAERKLLGTLNYDLREVEQSRFDGSGDLAFVMAKAIAAIEIEFSPYRAAEMKGRHWKPKTAEAAGKLKHANPPIAPNIFVKNEDLDPLAAWQEATQVPIVVLHVFDQEAFAVKLNTVLNFRSRVVQAGPDLARQLQLTAGIFRKDQRYDRVDAQGAAEVKQVYMVTPAASVLAANVVGVSVTAQRDISSSMKYVAHVVFEGGEIRYTPEFRKLLGFI